MDAVANKKMDLVNQRLDGLSGLVGNTPLLGIWLMFRGRQRVVYAKCEQRNLTGSIKDRMALHILKRAYADGSLRAGQRIAEATSGNTGIAFAALGRALGHPVTIFMPDWMSQERKNLIGSYGADIVLVRAEQGGFLGSIRMAEELAGANPKNVFLPRQFSNEANIEAHETTTGPEIWAQLSEAGLKPDVFVAGVGTGGTIMGVGRFLRRQNPAVRIHPVEPAESPTLSTGCKVGKHRIQGISDEFIPAIVNLAELDEVIAVSDGDSILMAQKLAKSLALGAGISSGCNLVAALQAQEALGEDAVVVTVFADDNKKYLSTDLLREEPVRGHYVSSDVELISVVSLPPTCAFCGGARSVELAGRTF
jgi:cysteine synthase A